MANKTALSHGRGGARWLLLLAGALGVLALILYLRDGRTSFDPNYSVYAIVGFSLGIAFALAGVIAKWRPLYFLSYLAFLYAFIHYIVSQINLIANILYGVDGSTFSAVFYVTIISAFAACLLALIAGIVAKGKYAARA